MVQLDYAALKAAALAARERAYAPYSRFLVGAAVLTASGKIFPGCNIENAAYSVGVCAERAALFSAYAAGEQHIVAMAVVTATEAVASPCGACRQVMIELAPDCPVLLFNLRGDEQISSSRALLPNSFGTSQLDEAARHQAEA